MKRDQNLRNLSSDHHHALALSRKIAKALDNNEDRSLMPELVREVFHEKLEHHFELEETALLPELEKVGEHALVKRTLDEHVMLRSLVKNIDQPGNLLAFSQLLKAHVKFEEQELFEACQDTLDDVALNAIGERCER